MIFLNKIFYGIVLVLATIGVDTLIKKMTDAFDNDDDSDNNDWR